jgi:hypothetical protein
VNAHKSICELTKEKIEMHASTKMLRCKEWHIRYISIYDICKKQYFELSSDIH